MYPSFPLPASAEPTPVAADKTAVAVEAVDAAIRLPVVVNRDEVELMGLLRG